MGEAKQKGSSYSLTLEIANYSLESETVELKGGYFLPVINFQLNYESNKIKISKEKAQKILQVYSHYRREDIQYEVELIEVQPSAGEINLSCSIKEAIKCSLQHGTIYFKIETSDGKNDNLMFADSRQASYQGSMDDEFELSLLIPENSVGGSYHKIFAYIKEKDKEIQVGRIDIKMEIVGAWKIERDWTSSDHANFQTFSATKLREYDGKAINCADLGLTVLTDYACDQGLPLTLKNRAGMSFNSCSEKYKSKEQYLKDILPKIQAIDIPSNTFTLDDKVACVGDMKVILKPWNHLVIYNSVTPIRKLTYGDFDSSTGKDMPVKYNKYDYTNTDTPTYLDSNNVRQTMNVTYTPSRTKIHRWNVFK